MIHHTQHLYRLLLSDCWIHHFLEHLNDLYCALFHPYTPFHVIALLFYVPLPFLAFCFIFSSLSFLLRSLSSILFILSCSSLSFLSLSFRSISAYSSEVKHLAPVIRFVLCLLTYCCICRRYSKNIHKIR